MILIDKQVLKLEGAGSVCQFFIVEEMLRAIIISALTIGIANAIHDDHGGQQTEPNLPVSSPDDLPAKDEDADDVVPIMQTFISFPLLVKDRTLRVMLFKNTVDCTGITKTMLNGQNFTWLHTKDELLSKYDEPYLGAEALVVADKTNGRPLFLLFSFSLGKFDYALEPSSEQLVGCSGPNRFQALSNMKIWGKSHHLYDFTKGKSDDPTTSTEAPTTLDPSTPKTTTPRTTRPITTTPAPTVPPVDPPGIEFEVVLAVLIVVLMVIIVVVVVKIAKSSE